MKKWIVLILGLVLALSSEARVKVLKAKRYLDVRKGEYVTPANIVIKDRKILAINPKTIPDDAFVIERPDLTVLPGLMDMHVHLLFSLTPNYQLDFVQTDAAMATLNGVMNARKLLYAGFTTVRDLGQVYPGETFVDVALSRASEQRMIVAPHIIPAGHALSITGGHMDPDTLGSYKPGLIKKSYRTGVADGVDEVVKSVRYQIQHGAQVIKAAATAGVLSHEQTVGAQQYSFEELKAMVDEAARHHVFVSVHAHGTEGINAAIKAGVRSIEHGSLLNNESIRLMKEHGTFLVPTTYLTESINPAVLPPDIKAKAAELMPQERANLSKAIQAHVKIAFGTDTPVFPHGQNAKELSALVRRGMSQIEAIRAATVNASELMSLKDRGEIHPGMLADIVGLEGDPLHHIAQLEHISFVMKAGDVYKG